MRNLIDFLSRHSHWLLFLLLELISVVLIVQYNSYQGSVWLSSANAVVGKVYEWRSGLSSFFSLREDNRQLTLRNFYLERQVAQLSRLYGKATQDTTAAEKRFLHEMENYDIVQAEVIGGTINRIDNLLTINRGRAEGVAPGMGVVSGLGIVGVVIQASAHYAVVLPVINSKSRVSCTIRRRGYFGALRWYGEDACTAYVEDIPRHAHFKRGDWIETNGFSSIFPPGVPVGVIEEVYNAKDALSYRVRIRLANDFSNLRDVCVINNKGAEEQRQLIRTANDSLKQQRRE